MQVFKNIEIQPLATSTKEDRYLLSCNGQYYEANYPIVELLQILQEYDDEEEAISHYVVLKKMKYDVVQVKEIITQYLYPLTAENHTRSSNKTFLYEKELFSDSFIDKFSDTFRFLFKKWYMVTVVLLGLLVDCYFMITTENLLQFNSYVNVYSISGLLVFMLLSSLWHELGHASACKYYGIKHGGIGFGLYLNIPVLYTDVTEVWQLKRSQRCVVNLAGIYFQSYCLLGLLVAFFLTYNDILRYLILTMNFGFLMTLNPFFKFDGYWIASDLLGVPNLRKRSKELVGYLLRRMRKQPVKTIPYLLQINGVEKYCLLVYSILVNLFMGYYFFYIIPRFLYRFVLSFPDEMEQLISYLSNNVTPPFALLRNIGMQMLFLALIGVMAVNLIRPLLKYAKRK
ncbi:MAG: hypothetical protein K2G02_05130 [Phocaeicola sp.]|nr:hypothetical protein [Phocaeicola sp.]